MSDWQLVGGYNSISARAKAEQERRRRQTYLPSNAIPIPTTDEELLDLVYRLWGVRIPNVQVCETHSTPARAFCDAFFARSPMSVWWASRGLGGKSFLLSLLSITEAVVLRAAVNLLGGSGEQSKRVLEYMTEFWAADSAPLKLLVSEPSATKTRLTNGGKITALMASQRSVRGPHPQRLRMDEIDEMTLEVFDASMGQTMPKPLIPMQTTMSSTRLYTDGTMQEVLKRAAEKGWSVHEWCYKENLEPHGWLLPATVTEKRSQVTAAMWNSEYELQEPNPHDRAIQTDHVKLMFKKSLGEFKGDLHEYIEIEEPVAGAQYSTGADWARKDDYTEIITYRLDCNPIRLIAYERTGRIDWPVMIELFNKRVRRFPDGAYHDGTGIGDVVAGFISVPAQGIIMVGRARSDMLTNFIAAIERDEIESPFIASLEGQYRLASWDDVYGAGHLPDGIAAGALGYIGFKYRAYTEEQITRMAENKIDISGIDENMLAALRMSGVDIDELLRSMQK